MSVPDSRSLGTTTIAFGSSELAPCFTMAACTNAPVCDLVQPVTPGHEPTSGLMGESSGRGRVLHRVLADFGHVCHLLKITAKNGDSGFVC